MCQINTDVLLIKINVNLRLTNKIPVAFHNLKGCDSHFLMQGIGQFDQNKCYKNNI